MILLRACMLGFLFMMMAVPAQAASNGNLAVSAYITSWGYCWVHGTADIAFGDLDPLNPRNVQATGNVDVRCLGFSGNFTVGVTRATSSPLYLENGSNTIPYTLELPTSATGTAFIIGAISIPVTAHIQAGDYQFAPAGSYSDIVKVQINP